MTASPPAAERIGEVVEANSTAFTAQCYQLYAAPPLGSLVAVGDPAVYGVVCDVATAPLDPGRRVVARGAAERDEQAVYDENPQIAHLMATHMRALIVGHDAADGIERRLPPAPPRIHAFVRSVPDDTAHAFAADLAHLELLLQASVPAIDAVIAANLRAAAAVAWDPAAFRQRAAAELARALAADVPRLTAILRAL